MRWRNNGGDAREDILEGVELNYPLFKEKVI